MRKILTTAAIAVMMMTAATVSEAGTKGEADAINAALLKWVHCTGGAVRATFYDPNSNIAGRHLGLDWHGNVAAMNKPVPLGSYRTVTNADTGASVTVQIVDRGPGTIAAIDLSRAAARAIGLGVRSERQDVAGDIDANGNPWVPKPRKHRRARSGLSSGCVYM